MTEIGTEGLAKMAAKKPTRKVWLRRYETSDQGTFSDIRTDNGFECRGGEPPWRNNQPDLSCIPAGEWKFSIAETPRHGRVYLGENIPGRTAILFHIGNFCGDVKKGLKTDTQGCILLGRAVNTIAGQSALIASKDAFAGFMNDLEGEDFILTISWDEKINPERTNA